MCILEYTYVRMCVHSMCIREGKIVCILEAANDALHPEKPVSHVVVYL